MLHDAVLTAADLMGADLTRGALGWADLTRANLFLAHLPHAHHAQQGDRCNLAPPCRHHHEVKQSQGWAPEQASPGVMAWTTPAGRRYVVGPTCYPG
jgi:hypothetical protein